MNEIFTRTYNIEQKMTGGNTAPVAASGGANDPQIRAYLEGIQNDVRQIRSSQLANTGGGNQVLCPETSCITSTVFLSILFVQTAIIIGFVFFGYVIQIKL